ncbi:tRNA-uridine aminocarboxypropyltransferase [Balneatrix alpica]|uniref:tRNA-uridine aminocarboxypropyltransferase n=1 Tax=Balneatrix alpica TaxID=75684 RepID=A0ABV5ZFM1_9GAMM|nr:DTW domain-containing protein [Balneatrix alpica]
MRLELEVGRTDLAPYRKPFNARGSRIERCQGCGLPDSTCICDYQVQAQAEVEFWLILHKKEQYKPTNTGRLIKDVLPNSRLFEWHRTEPPASLLALLQDSRYQPWLVFPADEERDQQRLQPFARQLGKTPVFILLDGTWRQARRMFRLSPWLQQLPLISFQPQAGSGYGLRKALEENHLCTAEVGIELLRLAQEPAAEVLQNYFQVFNVHYVAGRLGQSLEPAAAARAWLADYRRQQSGQVVQMTQEQV